MYPLHIYWHADGPTGKDEYHLQANVLVRRWYFFAFTGMFDRQFSFYLRQNFCKINFPWKINEKFLFIVFHKLKKRQKNADYTYKRQENQKCKNKPVQNVKEKYIKNVQIMERNWQADALVLC